MEEFLGISFTNRSIVLAHTQKTEDSTELKSIQDILFPFPFEFNAMLDDQKVELLADRIADYVQENDLSDKECVVSLPMYMAQVKRAALPADLDERIVQKHLQWEVENLNARELSEYKVVKLDHSFMFGTYQEYVFVLIQKKILDSIKKIAQKTSLKIRKVLLDFDTILKYLNRFEFVQAQKNQVVFQIDAFQVSTFIYLNGLFFDYALQSLGNGMQNEHFEERVLQIIQSEMERIRSVFSQLPQVGQELQLFATRLITAPLRKALKENDLHLQELSIKSQLGNERFPSENIEAFGVTL